MPSGGEEEGGNSSQLPLLGKHGGRICVSASEKRTNVAKKDRIDLRTLLVCIDGRQRKGGMNNNRVAIVPKTWREKSKMLVA